MNTKSELILHTNPLSRGRVARWMLEEVGEPYEARVVAYGPAMKGPDYLSINPMGKVPALVHDGRVVTENAAILCYLAETFPAVGLMPEDRASFWRWMFFGPGPLEHALVNAAFGWDVSSPRERGRLGYGSVETVVGVLAAHLARQPYACGDRFSVVDVFLGSQVGFGLERGGLQPEPALVAYWGRLKDRPARLRAAAADDALAHA